MLTNCLFACASRCDHELIQDRRGNTFATRIGNVFIIGDGAKPAISLPKAKGVKLSVIEERDQIAAKKKKE